jgi:penicillin-binding protein 2
MLNGFHIKKNIVDFLKKINLRNYILAGIFIAIAFVLINRLFSLQIINGETYLDNFQLKIRREITTLGTRGNIYDRNGNILAYNELTYSVTIQDSYGETDHDKNLNATIAKVIDIVEKNGDTITGDFDIALNTSGEYYFTVSDATLLRFLADVYGHASVDDLLYEEKTKTAAEVVQDLATNYNIGERSDPENDKSSFVVGKGYSSKQLLQLVAIRYALNLNSYQKYIASTVAFNVSAKTVADIEENSNTLEGVSIAEGTVRKYTDSTYFSQIIGYTGKISTDELTDLTKSNPSADYDNSDVVGKAGIEKSMEAELQGKKGSETIYVDNLGKQLDVSNVVEPTAGNDVYLTIDKDLQETATDILEKKLSVILLSKIRNVKTYEIPENASSSSLITPIYDVYNACLNNIINLDHMMSASATDTEKAVYNEFLDYSDGVKSTLRDELHTTRTPYDQLTKEYQVYESYIVQYLYDQNVLMKDSIDTSDQTYQDWTTNETISLSDFLEYAIAQNWVNVSVLDLPDKYSDSSEVLQAIIDYLEAGLSKDTGFIKKEYKYALFNDSISPQQICTVLMDQKIVSVPAAEQAQFESGAETPYTFMVNRITNLDITPAQLALDPYSGSMVITDTTSGDVLAMVTYPSYDNNRMSNGVDADYYESLREDASKPLINYATQQKTAPGSTFKPVTATAGLMEGAITLTDEITCTGTFTKIEPNPHCWIWPNGAHGQLNVTGGIKNSCNCFFYEVGYRLGLTNGVYDSDTGLEKLKKYADMYGLTDTSGIEIEEASPSVSTQDSVRSAIGQGNSGYTTTELARYVTTVANSGTCYNLTLIDKIDDTNGNLIEDKAASVRNVIDMPTSYWDAIHLGMREVVEGKSYFNDFPVNVAGKTGTAQESNNRPNHALFICYAPYESPKIAVATRVANGYTSDYAAQITQEVLKYYFNLSDREDILNSNTQLTGSIGAD